MRTEKDSMGEMRVPDEALWGASTQRAVLNFPISGRPMPAAFIRGLGLVKLAAARANAYAALEPIRWDGMLVRSDIAARAAAARTNDAEELVR